MYQFFLALCGLALLVVSGSRMQAAAPAPQQGTPAQPATQAPQAVFQRYCLSCHNQAAKSRGVVPVAFDDLPGAGVAGRAEA